MSLLSSSVVRSSGSPCPLIVKLPRSNSSPSPPSIRNATGRAESSRRQLANARSSKRRPGSFGAAAAIQPDLNNVDFSSTYHAGSSSDQSGSDTAGEDSDDGPRPNRGRRTSTKMLRKDIQDTIRRKRRQLSPNKRTLSPVVAGYVAEDSQPRPQCFARSTSPHVALQNNGDTAPNSHTPSTRNSSLIQSTKKLHFGFAWMTVPKNYRESPDDGILTGLLFGPLIAAALLYSSLKQIQLSRSSTTFDPLPSAWRIELPRVLPESLSATESLALSRKSLVDYSTFCSFILLVQVCASWWFEYRCQGRRHISEGERGSVPRSETRRSWYYVLFTFIITGVILGVQAVLSHIDISIWRNISYFDIVIGSLFYQFCLYIAIRLAHGGFTVGELALVCFGGLSLGTELLNLTRARIWPVTTPFIKTYRLPTPLLIFQIALIAGSFLTGFLLSPLLVLSRHIAQKPVRRLRFPQEKLRQRRTLAIGFYAGTIIIVGILIGGWTWWSLGRRDPWLWAIFWLLEGEKQWSRPVLLAYWGLLGSISVAGWNRQLSRSRRYRPRNTSTATGDGVIVPVAASHSQNPKLSDNVPVPPSSGALGLTFPNLPNIPNGSQVAADLLDAADKHVPTLGVNARRKFFHALAVVMFLPGVAADPAFTHLSFSAAFALFIFAEYVRYFAIYPFGAAVHLFMNEFLDHKDSGTAILSHFYLLTGCAGPLWLEGKSAYVLAYPDGTLQASIVGKRIGKHRWSPSTSKTLEGSAAFVLSIVVCACLLRLAGLAESFSTLRYLAVITLSATLEALSDQNDNLTLPLYIIIMEYITMDAMDEPSQADKHADSATSISALGFTNLSNVTPFTMPFPRLPQAEEKERRPSRPATASIVEGSPVLLPSSSPAFIKNQPRSLTNLEVKLAHESESPSKIFYSNKQDSGISEDRSDIVEAVKLRPCLPDNLAAASFLGDSPGAVDSGTSSSDYDWASFMSAYASGQWHPQRTPNPPRSYIPPLSSAPSIDPNAHSTRKTYSTGALPLFNSSMSDPSLPTSSATIPIFTETVISSSPAGNEDITNSTSDTTLVTEDSVVSKPQEDLSKISPQIMPFASRRFRKSFTDVKPTLSSKPMAISLDVPPNFTLSPDATTAAATLRWAGARVNLSPLALPSPEHELTDPMRGVHAAIPGAHIPSSNPDPMTPGGLRKTRLGSFWEGTQDVINESGRLSVIPGSNPATPFQLASDKNDYFDASNADLGKWALPPPATAPINRSSPEEMPQDYFSKVPSAEETRLSSQRAVVNDIANFWPDLANLRRDSEPMELNISTVPALPRRICLTRQTSSPLPGTTGKDKGISGSRAVSDPSNAFKASRAVKEEQMFNELRYLAPPNPPDELERRRALYKYNIWNTGPDVNFDRIVHLVKLVFNTKAVAISLVDSTDQGDEPTVVLNACQDWRFVNNPLVTGSPNIRFYAGAPLRTQDGFNIGSLTLIDDAPRREFSPRQRHILKEFAAIVMRELELWRDKIQLRIRDKIQTSMEQFSRECLEIDQKDTTSDMIGTSMDRVYDRAARLVKRTLDVEEVVVMDVSRCEVIETFNAEANVSVVMHNGDPNLQAASRTLTGEEYTKLNTFFSQYPDGKISEGILPVCFRPFIPTHIQYALTVPVFNIDKRPFALICAYNASDPTQRFLEGHELSYLRAIGVIILSAVLKRRMMLADQAKSLFISNISHELRTPLHGILAAAELLADTALSHTQASFLHTVQACGTSLVETVNHVLDFTKLSGNVKSGGVDNVILRSQVDLEQLVEEAIDGSWIGYCARTSSMRESEIGTVYAPALEERNASVVTAPVESRHVEVVVDIEHRKGGWTLKCDKGGVRRVLMNLFGNSLKFTTDGYVHVSLRQLPQPNDDTRDVVRIELCVSDTGKGISQNFLKNHLFQPFSQENPLQAGTGLGLAIVNSIIQSPSVGGKVEVLSEENVGTEIKVIFEAEKIEDWSNHLQDPLGFEDPSRPPEISLLGFYRQSKGLQLLSDVLRTYLGPWWGFNVRSDGAEMADIVILNEDPSPVINAIENMDNQRSFIILSSSRGSPRIMGICNAYEHMNGFCRIVHKPGGPYRLRSALKQLLRVRQRRQHRSSSFLSASDATSDDISLSFANSGDHDNSSGNNVHDSMVTLDSGGTILKASIGAADSERLQRKVLVVEDNSILRNLLWAFLLSLDSGYRYWEATDGRQGVDVFQSEGVGAAVEIRQLEKASGKQHHSSILALTGMSSLEDKRKAFEAGMDGYLVKPVAFKTLEDMFQKLGLS
ncbi:Fph type histidine kinase [Hygrophoropsis aurantiaca]|uniref:Fph type histidine kinase n=1 Tax=Hygrophoropsis aurantiaca TaxID=72124 RepID=A0ACB8ADZ5_9AGAM|nr:Fph type histidine kinase [Hygrophoropsis aurantiaca]